jgi:hypothetical protein
MTSRNNANASASEDEPSAFGIKREHEERETTESKRLKREFVISNDMEGTQGWQHRHSIVDGPNKFQVHIFNHYTESGSAIEEGLQNLKDGNHNEGAKEYFFAWRIADKDVTPSLAAALNHVPLIHQGFSGDDADAGSALLRLLFNVGANNVILAVSRKYGRGLAAGRKIDYVKYLAVEALFESGNGKLNVLEKIANEIRKPVPPARLIDPSGELIEDTAPVAVNAQEHTTPPTSQNIQPTPPTPKAAGLDEAGPLCSCGKPSSTVLAQSRQNPGRPYWVCTQRKSGGKLVGCEFFIWKSDLPESDNQAQELPSPQATPVNSPGRAAPQNPPLCNDHREPCRLSRVLKQGDNQGRPFWQCPRYKGPNGPKCKFNGFADV